MARTIRATSCGYSLGSSTALAIARPAYEKSGRTCGCARLSSRVANRVAKQITGQSFRDAGCGLKVARAAVMKKVAFFRGAHRFVPALIAAAGGSVLEVEVAHRQRPWGQSKYGNGLGRSWGALRDAMGVRWLIDRRIDLTVREL